MLVTIGLGPVPRPQTRFIMLMAVNFDLFHTVNVSIHDKLFHSFSFLF